MRKGGDEEILIHQFDLRPRFAKKAPLTKIANDRLVMAVHILKVKERNLEEDLKYLKMK